MIKKTTLIFMVACLISGCANSPNNNDNGNGDINRVQTGAGIGALSGGLLGALLSHDKAEGAIIGAGIGALAGAGIGGYMDSQEKELRRTLRGSGVQVERIGDKIRLVLPNGVTFQSGSAYIQPSFYISLNQIAAIINRYPNSLVTIIGHTDNVGSQNINQQLSQNRAITVEQYLIAQQVMPGRINAYGVGFLQPIADNGSDFGRQLNRRVEIFIYSNQ